MHLVAATADHVAVEAHQEADLVGRARPVLGRERVGRLIAFTPISIAPSTTSKSAASPLSWPLVRGRPRALAQRPLPSMVIATCRGTSVGRDRGRPGAGRVRVRRAYGALHAGCRRVSTRGHDLAGSVVRSLDLPEPTLPARPSRTAARDQRSTYSRDRRPRSRCQCRNAATRPDASRRWRGVGGGDRRPVAGQQRAHHLERAGRRRGRAGDPAVRAQRATGGGREPPVRPGVAAARAVVERRRVAGHRERAEQVGVEHLGRRAVARRSSPAGRRRAAGTAAPTAASPRPPAGRRSRASRCRRCSGRSRHRGGPGRRRSCRPG